MDVDVAGIMGSLAARRPDPDDHAAVSRWMLGGLGVLHSPVYRSRELRARLEALGITDRMAGYFAQRSAPLALPGGGPSARLVTATFYGFSPQGVALHVPAVWDRAEPAAVLAATLEAMRELLGRLLADHGDQVSELRDLLAPVADQQEIVGRPLAAAWSDVARTGDAVVDLWLAATVIRESRGDGHVALLVAEGIGPLESHLISTGDRPEVREALIGMRGWTAQEIDAAVVGLQEQELLDGTGRRTDACRALRLRIEQRTDERSAGAWADAGPEAVARISTLLLEVLPPVLASGTLLPAVVQRLRPQG